jgi:hypothetical protein
VVQRRGGVAGGAQAARPVGQVDDEEIGDPDRVRLADRGHLGQVTIGGGVPAQRRHDGQLRGRQRHQAGMAGGGGQRHRLGGRGPGLRPGAGHDLDLGAAGESVFDHVQGACAAGRGELLLVQPQVPLVVVDQPRGDAEVGLQHVIVDRVGVGEGEGAPERLGGGRPVLAGSGEEPDQQCPGRPWAGRRLRRRRRHERGEVDGVG